MISSFDRWIARLQRFCAFPFFIGLSFSISLWQYSLLAAAILTLIRFVRESGQRRMMLSEPFLFALILIYVGWTALCAFLMNPGDHRFAGVTEEWLFVILPVVWSVMGDASEKYRGWLFRLLAIAIVVIPLLSILSHLLGYNILRPGDVSVLSTGRASGAFDHPLTFAEVMLGLGAVLLAFGIISIAHNKNTLLYLIAAAMAMLGVIASGSRTAIAGVLIISVLMAVYNWSLLPRIRWYLLLIPLVAVLLPLLLNEHAFIRATEHVGRDFRDVYQGSRIFIWERGLQMIGAHPIFGVGPNGFGQEYLRLIPDWVDPHYRFHHAHNDLINVTATRGILGGLLFLLMWGTVLVKGASPLLKERSLSSEHAALKFGALVGLIALLCCSITESTFVDEEVRGVIMLLWALLLMPTRSFVAGGEESSGSQPRSAT